MANPQLERGHTRIANEILEHTAKANLSGGELRIVMVVWRYTYGFGRKEHRLSLSFLEKATDLSRRAVQKYIDRLIARKVINGKQIGSTRMLGFNKNYQEWELEEVKEEKETKVPEDNKPPKKKKRVYEETDTFYKMAKHFLDLLKPVAEEANVSHLIKKANLQTWADDFRKLWEVDGVKDKKQILEMMEWVTKHHFWHKNVLSGKKFREKYAELAIAKAADMKPKQNKFQHPSHSMPDARDEEIAFNKWVAAGNDPDEFTFSS